jgi:hypothetical protein
MRTSPASAWFSARTTSSTRLSTTPPLDQVVERIAPASYGALLAGGATYYIALLALTDPAPSTIPVVGHHDFQSCGRLGLQASSVFFWIQNAMVICRA